MAEEFFQSMQTFGCGYCSDYLDQKDAEVTRKLFKITITT